MNNVICFVAIIGCVGSFPLELDMTAGLRNGNSTDEGELVEGDIIALGHSLAKNLVREPSQLWPDKIFPYKFSADFNQLQKLNVESALADLASQTCVQFRERTHEPTYIVFKNYGKICASVVGYMDLRNFGGEMPIYVSYPGCEMQGQIQHEVLHSLGFWHEHTRPDRNEYITVNWDSIEPGSQSNFEARTWADTQTLDLPYDINSVMHYSERAFSRDGSATLTPKFSRNDANMGQRFRVSKLDVAKMNRLYNCDDRYYKGNEIAGY